MRFIVARPGRSSAPPLPAIATRRRPGGAPQMSAISGSRAPKGRASLETAWQSPQNQSGKSSSGRPYMARPELPMLKSGRTIEEVGSPLVVWEPKVWPTSTSRQRMNAMFERLDQFARTLPEPQPDGSWDVFYGQHVRNARTDARGRLPLRRSPTSAMGCGPRAAGSLRACAGSGARASPAASARPTLCSARWRGCSRPSGGLRRRLLVAPAQPAARQQQA